MKFIFKTIFKILVLFIILIIPVGLFITFFALNQKQIPVWNIGIRNIVLFSKNYALPIITISYFIATLLTVSLIDKMKVRSIFLLHIPAVLIGVVIIGVFFLIQSNNYPLSLIEKRMYLGYRTFLKENVFNDLRERSVLLMRTDQNQFTVYLYDKVNNSLIIMNNMNASKKGKNHLYVDQDGRQIVLREGQKKKITTVNIPYDEFNYKSSILNNKMILFYAKQLRGSLQSFRALFAKLPPIDQFVFFGAIYLSLLMISIPFTYALNDGGWGFSGIIGVVFILVILPFLYGIILKSMQNFSFNLSFLGKYSYLFPAIIYGFIGILIDIAVKVRGMKKGI